MKYRILFHSHVFVHKAHAVFFRLSEPRKVLIMADYPLIGMQFFRGPCFSRSAVHRQIAGDFELSLRYSSPLSVWPVRITLVRGATANRSFDSPGARPKLPLSLRTAEPALYPPFLSNSGIHILMLSACFVSLLREMTVSSVLPLLARTIANVLSGHDIRLDSHIGFHPVEHEPCIVWAGPVKLPVANDDLIARQHYGDDCSHVRKQAYHLRRAFPPFHPLRPRASADALRRIGVIRRFGSVGGFPFLGGVPFLRGFPSFLDHSLSFPFPILEVFHGSYKRFYVC